MKSKIPKPRKGAWFVKLRGSYLPASWQGWLTYIPYIMLIVLGLLYVFSPVLNCINYDFCDSNALPLMMLNAFVVIVPYFVALVVVMQWIAKRKS